MRNLRGEEKNQREKRNQREERENSENVDRRRQNSKIFQKFNSNVKKTKFLTKIQ